MWKWTLLFCISVQICWCQIRHIPIAVKSQLNIVGVFEPSAAVELGAFDESMRSAVVDGNRRLEPIVIKPSAIESYNVLADLCTNTSVKTIAVLGPHNLISDRGVLNHCAKLNIPYLQATWQPFDPESGDDDLEDTNDNEEEEGDENEEEEYEFKKFAINFYPDANEVANAYADVLKFYNWESFIVLYEDDYGLLRVQKIISDYSTNFLIVFRKLDPDSENYEIFKELSKMQESRIILDCHVDNILKYIEAAEKLNMVNAYQHYTLISMDTSRVADKLSKYSSNFTWLGLMEYENLNSAQGNLNSRVSRWQGGISQPVVKFPMDALIMDDIAGHVLKAAAKSDIPPESQGKLCGTSRRWKYGAKLQEQILSTTTTGVTGKISFDPMTGKRKDYTLYLNEIHQTHLHTIATWKAHEQEFISDKQAVEIRSSQSNNKTFIVMSRPAEPYIARKKCYIDHEKGPDCKEDDDGIEFEGFSVDLVKEIFEVLKGENYTFKFKFEWDPNITYGKYDSVQKKWDGLMGKLLDKQADLVVCDLTMTEQRKKLVDFSVPIMTVGISILFTKDNKVPPDTLSFLKPYSVEMWIYTATAYCIVSIVLFICSRISPGDWENPQPCDKEPEELENIWNFKNSTWLTMGSIMTQGCDILPKAFGSRWVCAMWWFFAMIVCQTYIAQLAASLSSAKENAPIESVEDLAKQTKVLYGAFEAGSTIEFFEKAKDKMYRKIYDNMIAKPGVLVESNEIGEKRVIASKNKYAFFMESASIEYKMKRNCLLRKVGGELDSKDYGIGMPANSPYRSIINRAILKLKENNKLNDIKDKWWNKEFGATPCEETVDVNDVEGDLELENLAGAFYFLIGGLFIALFITAAEFVNEVRNIVVREQVDHKEVFIKELKASLNFCQLQKPVIRNPSRAPSLTSRESSQKSLKSNRSNVRAQFLSNFLEFEKGPQ